MSRLRSVPRLLVAAVLAVGLVGGGVAVGAAAGSSAPKAVKVCVTKKGVVRAASAKGRCPKKTHKVTVATMGPKGATGAMGAKGAKGDPGPGAQGFEKRLAPGDPVYRVPGTDIYATCNLSNLAVLSPLSDDGNFVGTYAEDSDSGSTYSYVDQGTSSSGRSPVGTRVSLDGIFTPLASPSATVHEQVSMIWLPTSQVCEVFGQVTPSS